MASICPICFDDLGLDGKEKASPDACEHVFCLSCLEKWSKLGSYCPVDRKRYKKIVNLDSESVIQVKPRKRKRKRIVYDFSTTCENCNTDNDPDTLLLCDCCDLGFHCYCLTPPLETVPAGLWFCPTCVTVEEKLKQRKGITKEMELDYDNFLQKLNYYEPASSQTKKQKLSSPLKSTGNLQDTFKDIVSVFEDINVVPDSGKNVKAELNDISSAETMTVNVNSMPVVSQDDVSYKLSSTLLASSAEVSIRKCPDPEEELVKSPSIIPKNLVKTSLETNTEDQPSVTGKQHVSIQKYTVPEELAQLLGIIPKKFVKTSLETNTEDQLSVTGKQHVSIQNYTAPEELVKLPAIIPQKYVKTSLETNTDDQFSITGKQYAHDLKMLNKDQRIIAEKLVTFETDAQTPSCKSSLEKPIKGTFSIFSDGIVKSGDLGERSGLDLCVKNAQSRSEEKFRFSVFEVIEDIDSSQKKYSNISALSHISLSSNTNLYHCSLCKDMTSFASKKHCKICRKNYLKKKSSIIKSEELLKHTIESKARLAGLNSNYKASENIHILGNSKKMSSKSYMSSLERRQHSFLQELKKIQANK